MDRMFVTEKSYVIPGGLFQLYHSRDLPVFFFYDVQLGFLLLLHDFHTRQTGFLILTVSLNIALN